MLKYLLSLFIFLWWFPLVIFAQDSLAGSPTIYSSLNAKKYKILIVSNKVYTVHSLDSLRGKILYVSRKDESRQISTDIIKQLSVARKQKPMLKSIGLGILGGVVAGAVIGRLAYVEPEPNAFFDIKPDLSALGGAIIGSLGGTLVGTIIGASSHKYEHHDFTKVPLAERQKLMSNILMAK